MRRWFTQGIPLLFVVLVLGACVMERTVTDGSGELIYQDTEIHTPFESEKKKDAEVEKKERELGW